MNPIIMTDRAVLLEGDAANVRAVFAPGTVHSIVTDPPAGIGFMGKEWDSDRGGRDQWVAWLAEVMRGAHELLVPGGHALVWALPRTAHWTMTALEDAGFEVRDVVSHLFGTGFPKSLDVSKAIDKAAGAERAVVGQHEDAGADRWRGDVQGHEGKAEAILGGPVTPEAAAWEGWGTALKPGAEFWILARKPLSGTVASNVLAHGTGALNIDGCRIESGADYRDLATTQGAGHAVDTYTPRKVTRAFVPASGRWPANVVLSHTDACFEVEPDRFACVSECAVRQLDDQAGTRSPGNHPRKRSGIGYGSNARGTETTGRATPKGDASRFFYVPKISRSERDLGCESLPVRAGHDVTDREEGSGGLKSPRAGAGRGEGARNHHPTVKPQALMRWLIRLITPPGGTVLDLFVGSGSTGVAALAEGFNFIGTEANAEYAQIAAARINRALGNTACAG